MARPRPRLYQLYEVDRVLGRGACATVVKARHRRENECYAVKMFSGDGLRTLLRATHFKESEQEMGVMATHLRQQIEFLQGLHHPYVCGLKEAFIEGYEVSVALDLAKGGDLSSYVLKRGVLFELEGQYFTYQICDALEYIHNQGIAHRDLKPENVLLTDDTPPMVKLADYGIVRIIESISDLQARCGTPAFLVPVVPDNAIKGYEIMVDSWSLGAMLFKLLTRSSPFTDTSSEPDWFPLEDYNISDIGVDFIRRLLQFTPCARMTPSQALNHPWIVEQGPKQRARLIEREESLLRDSARRQAWLAAEEHEAGVAQLGEYLPTSSGGDEDRVAAERARDHQGTMIGRTPQPLEYRIPWLSSEFDSDEIPGLGLFHG